MLGQMGCTTNPAARLAAVDVLRRAHLTDAQFSRVLSIIRGDALVSPGTLAPAFREVTSPENAKQVVASLIQAIQEGWRAAESDLDGVLRRLPVEAQLEAGALRELARKNETGAAKLKQYEPLLTAGDAERGRTVFFGPKVACSTCHAIGEAGGKVGPDLTKVGAVRSGRDILESILLPNASFAQGYDNYRGVIKDGEEISGVIAGQSPEAIILRGASGAERQVPRDQIQELTRSEISLMPEGLEQGMTAQEFSDLLAFLQGLK
jgi:putative heme-binding domain-containing protein